LRGPRQRQHAVERVEEQAVWLVSRLLVCGSATALGRSAVRLRSASYGAEAAASSHRFATKLNRILFIRSRLEPCGSMEHTWLRSKSVLELEAKVYKALSRKTRELF